MVQCIYVWRSNNISEKTKLAGQTTIKKESEI